MTLVLVIYKQMTQRLRTSYKRIIFNFAVCSKGLLTDMFGYENENKLFVNFKNNVIVPANNEIYQITYFKITRFNYFD